MVRLIWRKWVSRGLTKIARDRDACKLILKEAKVLNGSQNPWRSEKLLMRHESSSTTHKQTAEVPKGTVQSLRSQTVKIWKTKITTLIIWFLHKAELTIMNLFLQNKQPTKHYTLPPINPTPLLYLRVTWMHDLLYPGSCGRWSQVWRGYPVEGY